MNPEIKLLLVFGALYVLSSLRIAQEYERVVVFLLGRYKGIMGPGLYFLPRLFFREAKVALRTQIADLERQEAITKDSVTIKVNAVLWFRVADPAKAVLEVEDFREAVYQVALTSLRNVLGQHQLDEILKERDQINAQIRTLVDAATDPWGIEVQMLEMKDVEIPEGMQRAMAREAEASREKRARLIKAEAEQEAGERLCQAAERMAKDPVALELRRIQMIAEVGTERNTMTIVCLPSDFLALGQHLAQTASNKSQAGK